MRTREGESEEKLSRFPPRTDSAPIARITTTALTSSANALCRTQGLPPRSTIDVFDLRSAVEDVTDAVGAPLASRSTRTLFFDSCSWIRTTFSAPRTTKYPPGSSGHSRSAASSASERPRSTQRSLRSMMGRRPISRAPVPGVRPLRTTSSRPRVYSTSTVTGAA